MKYFILLFALSMIALQDAYAQNEILKVKDGYLLYATSSEKDVNQYQNFSHTDLLFYSSFDTLALKKDIEHFSINTIVFRDNYNLLYLRDYGADQLRASFDPEYKKFSQYYFSYINKLDSVQKVYYDQDGVQYVFIKVRIYYSVEEIEFGNYARTVSTSISGSGINLPHKDRLAVYKPHLIIAY